MVDPAALDAASGARARLRVVVPEAWGAAGEDVAITTPARLACAACDGGGCDGCGRSGAYRAPAEPAARTLRVTLPERVDGVVLRVVHPFGEGQAPEQLLLELAAGPEPSPGVAREPRPALRRPRVPTAAALAVLALVASIAAALLAR